MLDLIEPIMKDDIILIPIAINRAVNPSMKKYGIIGSIPPSRNAPNMFNAPFNGLPTIVRLMFNSSLSIVFNHTSLFDVILSTIVFNSSP